MRRVERGNEVMLLPDETTPQEEAAAWRRVDERHAAVERHFQRQRRRTQYMAELAADQAQALYDAEIISRAYSEDAAGRQYLADVARAEEQARIEEEALRRAEDRARADLANRSDSEKFIDALNNEWRAKMPKEDFDNEH